jgi:hypothetical protein
MKIVKPTGMVGLLTPSGIASDKTASAFFKQISTKGRLRALYDFENRRTRYEQQPFFPDVDSRFKFCTFIASPTSVEGPARCAFFLQDPSELFDPERCFTLGPEDFARVNPNTGTAPIFRTRRDADITTAVYRRVPVLVKRGGGSESKAWPVRYATMFHKTNDSHRFRTPRELENKENAYPIGRNRWRNKEGDWVPLYEGKMSQAFDHRAASVVVNPSNQHRPGQPAPATLQQHRDVEWSPTPQFWVRAAECGCPSDVRWVLGFKEITAPTNERTFISALFPTVGFSNKLPLLKPESADNRLEFLLCANFNSVIFDFITRQKIQGQTLNLFIVEQLPVISPDQYCEVRFGHRTAFDIVRDITLELTYTADDMASFAESLGYCDNAGNVRLPFIWDEQRRINLRAKLDAVYFHLYGVVDHEDIKYVYSTFPITERQELATWGNYRSRELCLAWLRVSNGMEAGPRIGIQSGPQWRCVWACPGSE